MSATVHEVTEKPAFTILVTAIAVALLDNIVVAFSASIPWITQPDVHAFFMASVICVLSIIAMLILARKEQLKLKAETATIPFIVFSISFFIDRYVLSYIKSLAVPIKLFGLISLSSLEVSLLYAFVFTIVFVIVIIGIVYLFIKKR